jgi:hypothetical protein
MPNGAMLLRFHRWSFVTVSLLGAGLAQNAFAQSTGSEAIEEDIAEVVVSATRVRNIGLMGEQTAPKSRISLSGEYLETQLSGQSVFQSLNQIPGVNFTNSDAFGGSGGYIEEILLLTMGVSNGIIIFAAVAAAVLLLPFLIYRSFQIWLS